MFRTSSAALAGAALLASLASAAMAQEKFANFMPPTHPYVAGAFQPFADKVKEYSNGEVSVQLYNGGELGPGPVEQYSRVVDGVAEFAVSLPGYTASNFPMTLVAELPGVLDPATGTDTIWENIDFIKGEYRRAPLVALWSSAPNLLYMRDKPVHSPDDLKGLKIRVPSRNSGLLIEAWGATPVSMPVSEIYNAMQTGVIDGAFIDGTATRAFRLGEVANHLTVGMDATNSPFFILMNRDTFNALSEANQAAVLKAGREASNLGQAVQLTVAEAGIKAFGEMDGKEVIHLTAEEAAPFNAAAAKVVEQVVEETGGDARAFVEALQGS
ncbi:TRAP transporter substrate-binding protein [Acuticoccus kandeliae]|uniref:TRAP transporter substrate-binding protein n=1 Tax=Acuticoccus kandeliae TaxID=2073160 RepID=UPI000D3EA9CB|nr:TRAP transporter substrate-binding protein [Acuticoccus kandeliae]